MNSFFKLTFLLIASSTLLMVTSCARAIAPQPSAPASTPTLQSASTASASVSPSSADSGAIAASPPQSNANSNSTALPANVYPVPANICQLQGFYRVQTPDGAPMVLVNYRASPPNSIEVPNSTTILEPGRPSTESPYRQFFVPGQGENSFTFDRSGRWGDQDLVRLTFGSEFRGQMQVKTLDPGGSLNVHNLSPDAGNLIGTIGSVADGTVITVLGSYWRPDQPAPQKGDDLNLYIETPNGVRGFVDSTYLVCPRN